MRPAIPAVLVWALLTLLAASAGDAQELSPRAYWPAPRGTRVAIVGYSYSSGDVVTDPSLPVAGVDSRIHTTVLGYLHTLSLWGRTANLIIELPRSWGTTTGTVEGESSQRDLSGFGDLAVTLSANILGAPSMTPADLRELRDNPRSILGASLKVLAPTGDYEDDKLINVGANRWAVKAELGYILPVTPRWLLESELGVWAFSDNDSFLGATRGQEPIVAGEIHLVRRFRAGFWASLELNYFAGGRTTVAGDARADLQRNARLGATTVYPFRGRHAVKAGYSTGVVTDAGGDYGTLLLSYQLLLR
jgi:hypothetical protein